MIKQKCKKIYKISDQKPRNGCSVNFKCKFHKNIENFFPTRILSLN